MNSTLSGFQLELNDAVLLRTYLTSKRDMLGIKQDGERLKTILAVLLGEIIEKWYMTSFTEDNICTETEIQIALETFNYLCNSNVWYGEDVLYSTNPIFYTWDDTEYWNDLALWLESN